MLNGKKLCNGIPEKITRDAIRKQRRFIFNSDSQDRRHRILGILKILLEEVKSIFILWLRFYLAFSPLGCAQNKILGKKARDLA